MSVLAAFPSTAHAYQALFLGALNVPDYGEEIRTLVHCAGFFEQVHYLDVGSDTPTISDLTPYDAVFVFGDIPFDNASALGDLLVQYNDAGGGVVLAAQTCVSGAGTAPLGTFDAQGYAPWTTGTFSTPGGNLGFSVEPGFEDHEALRGFNVFDGGTASAQCSGIEAANGGTVIAWWENGEPLVLVREGLGGRVVGLNMFPPSNASNSAFWLGDGDWLIQASLLWSLGFEYPYASACWQDIVDQDLNCNGVDVSDEPPADTDDTACLYDTDGSLFNMDYYHEHEAYGCQYFVGDMDVDADLLTGLDLMAMPPLGVVPIQDPDATFPSRTAYLRCDNCTYDFNPLQEDIDCDQAGDLCDNCALVPNEDQMNGQLCVPAGQEVPGPDCWGDACDNCPCVENADQMNVDDDSFGDACDNCPEVTNEDQVDQDRDGYGDACDVCPEDNDPGQEDFDLDGVGDACDNCQRTVNPDQTDSDHDGMGDACDNCPLKADADTDDDDGDTVGNVCDNCPKTANVLQTDDDGDGLGNECDICPNHTNAQQWDADEDNVGDECDNCPLLKNKNQIDEDLDGVGDSCDNCLVDPNLEQDDRDEDGFGDVCDYCPATPTEENTDLDEDEVGDACDNCPAIANTDQNDEDEDTLGDACDGKSLRGGGSTAPEARCATGSPGVAGGLSILMALAAMRCLHSRRRPMPRRGVRR